MKKTKHFNISVPELGDVPDITQVSNAISDLEDATAGTLEIMKAEMQGTKITLTSVSRKTKRTGYYEGMSIRFKSPQDIEPNYLKTISVDGLGDQELSVTYKVNRNEYIDIVYEGNKFTAYPVVVQKTDSVSNNSSVLVGTAKGVKTAYDKGVEALNKANQAQSAADSAQTTADGKVSKSGDTMTGTLCFDKFPDTKDAIKITSLDNSYSIFSGGNAGSGLNIYNYQTKNRIFLGNDGSLKLDGNNLNTSSKEVVSAINELNSGKENKIDKKSGFNLDKTDNFEDNTNKVLTAKGGNNLFEMVQGNSGIKFDKNLLFLNDNGEKKKGNVYLDRLQNGMFECIKTTTSTVNNSSYFRNFANKELSNRIDNLCKPKKIKISGKAGQPSNNKDELIEGTIEDINNYKFLFVVFKNNTNDVGVWETTIIVDDITYPYVVRLSGAVRNLSLDNDHTLTFTSNTTITRLTSYDDIAIYGI